MRFVDRDCVAPQLAVETLGALARFQPFDERRSAAAAIAVESEETINPSMSAEAVLARAAK